MGLDKEKVKILENLGFERMDNERDRENFVEYYGILPEYVLSGKFSVAGDHADDATEFYYVDNLPKRGFYYSSSLFDTFYYGEHKVELDKIIDQVKTYVHDDYEIHSKKYAVNLSTVTTNNTTWFIVENDLDNEFFSRVCVQSIMKASIVLDFLMQNYENDYYEKQKEND